MQRSSAQPQHQAERLIQITNGERSWRAVIPGGSGIAKRLALAAYRSPRRARISTQREEGRRDRRHDRGRDRYLSGRKPQQRNRDRSNGGPGMSSLQLAPDDRFDVAMVGRFRTQHSVGRQYGSASKYEEGKSMRDSGLERSAHKHSCIGSLGRSSRH